MQKLIVRFNQKNNKPDIANFSEYKYRFYSQTTLAYFDEDEIFHHPIKIQFCRHKNLVFCMLRVLYGQYDLQGGGSCLIGQYLSTERAMKQAATHAGMEISPEVDSGILSNWGFHAQEEVAIAIAHALELNPKRWTLISSGGKEHNFY